MISLGRNSLGRILGKIPPGKDIPRKDRPRKGVPREGLPNKELPRKCLPRKDLPRKDLPRKDLSRKGLPRKDLPMKNLPRIRHRPRPLHSWLHAPLCGRAGMGGHRAGRGRAPRSGAPVGRTSPGRPRRAPLSQTWVQGLLQTDHPDIQLPVHPTIHPIIHPTIHLTAHPSNHQKTAIHQLTLHSFCHRVGRA